MYGGARGGGKTDGLLGDWIQHWRTFGKYTRGIIFRRTYDELDEVQARAEELYKPMGAEYLAGKRTWHMPDGAPLKMRHLSRDADASHYQGHSYTFVGIDEAGNFASESPIDKINGTLRSKHGIPCVSRLTANPGGPGHSWLKARYIDPAPPMTPHLDEISGQQRIYIPSRLQDNQLLIQNDPNYVKRLKGSGPAWLVSAWLNGDWNATPEGGIVKAEWFRRYTVAPSSYYQIVQSWDTAYKPDQINDPSVCTTWMLCQDGEYLLDVYRARMDYPALKRAVSSMAEKWSPDAILVEDKASGQSLIQELKTYTRLPVIAINPETDKITRMIAVTPMFEAGRVHLPVSAPWLLDYELELTIFPLAPHDDQVDSTSQALAWAKTQATRIEVASSGQRAIIEATGAGDIDVDTGFGVITGINDFEGF